MLYFEDESLVKLHRLNKHYIDQAWSMVEFNRRVRFDVCGKLGTDLFFFLVHRQQSGFFA